MASRGPERSVQLPVLDRLIDDRPGQGDAPIGFHESVRRLKQAVLRDLDWLLNTRRNPEPVPDAYPEAQRSAYLYGLPDTTSLSADDPETRRALQQRIEECIRLFEPRLASVEVTLVAAPDNNKRMIRFVVEAILRMDPDPVRVVFDTMLDPSSGAIRVEGEHA